MRYTLYIFTHTKIEISLFIYTLQYIYTVSSLYAVIWSLISIIGWGINRSRNWDLPPYCSIWIISIAVLIVLCYFALIYLAFYIENVDKHKLQFQWTFIYVICYYHRCAYCFHVYWSIYFNENEHISQWYFKIVAIRQQPLHRHSNITPQIFNYFIIINSNPIINRIEISKAGNIRVTLIYLSACWDWSALWRASVEAQFVWNSSTFHCSFYN